MDFHTNEMVKPVEPAEDRKVVDLSFAKRLRELPITKREKEILVHLAQGKTNKEISDDLVLSTSTVRNHISSIFTKLNISNRSQATAIAIYSGLLDPLEMLASAG